MITTTSARDNCNGGHWNWDGIWGGGQGFCGDGHCDDWEPTNGNPDSNTIRQVLENLPAGSPFAGRDHRSASTNLMHFRKVSGAGRVIVPRECTAGWGTCSCQPRWDRVQFHPIVQNRFCRSTRQGRQLSEFNGCDCVDWGCTCQGMSDTYETNAGVTWGRAPQHARDWWIENGCSTYPDNACVGWGCTCQGMSDTFGTDAGKTWGSAHRQEWRTWWIVKGCNTRLLHLKMGACASDPQNVDEEINAEFDGENEVDFEVGDVVDPMEQMNIDQSGGMMQYSNFGHGAVMDETTQQEVNSGDMYDENQMATGVVGGGAVGNAQVYNPETDGQYFATLEEAQAAAGQSSQVVDDMQYNSGAQQDAYLPQGVEYDQGFQQPAMYDQSEMPVGQNMQYSAGYEQSAPVAMPTGQYDQYAQAENYQGQQGMMMGQQGVMVMDNQMVVDPQSAQAYGMQMNMNTQQMPTDADGVAYEVDDEEAQADVQDTQQESKKKKRRWW